MPESLKPYDLEPQKLKTECGIFGLYLHPSFASYNIVEETLSAAICNQHRGEESAGFCISDGCSVSPVKKNMGLIRDLYKLYLDTELTGGVYGYIGIVHNRYSTTGSSKIENAAPFRFATDNGAFAVAHNGNITNASRLKAELFDQGCKFTSTTDSEVIGALIANSSGSSWKERITNAVKHLEGSFSLLISTKDTIFAVRDSHGFHPLSIAKFSIDGKDCFAVSSETSAFSKFPIEKVWDVKPGTLVEINNEQLTEQSFADEPQEAFCGLEFAYLMRPDARFEHIQMDTIRRRFGAMLARLYPVPESTDFITYIPESARPAAEGFAEETSRLQGRYIPTLTTSIKGRYGNLNGTHRGFINPSRSERTKVARQNYYPFDILTGKNIALIDDSVVSADVTEGVDDVYKNGVGELKDRGASQIHVRIVFPPVISTCPFGVDIDDTRFLAAREFESNLEKIASYIHADSLAYLSIEDFSQVIEQTIGRRVGLCMGCTTGIYPGGAVVTKKLIFEKEKV